MSRCSMCAISVGATSLMSSRNLLFRHLDLNALVQVLYDLLERHNPLLRVCYHQQASPLPLW